jgi:hypothetical protein
MATFNMPMNEMMMASKPGVAGKSKRVVAAGFLAKGVGGKKSSKTFSKKKAAGFLRKSGKK